MSLAEWQAMLISSILQILDQQSFQPKATKKAFEMAAENAAAQFRIPNQAATTEVAEESSGLHKIELEIAAAAGLLRPLSLEHPLPAAAHPGPSAEELIRAITKFERPHRSRFVDVFE
jgi:hypothetical protein